MGETITRAQLSEAIYQEVGLSRNESADLLEMVLGEITDALLKGEAVKISSFGSFSVRQKGQRIGRNCAGNSPDGVGFTNSLRQLRIAERRPNRNFAECFPNAMLKCGPANIERQVQSH